MLDDSVAVVGVVGTREIRIATSFSPMRRLVEAAAALALVATLCGAAAANNPHLAEGKRHLEAMDESAALASFERALRHARTKAEQAEIHVYRGIALFNLLKAAEGRVAFRRALKLDAAVALPKLTSPKIASEFARMKKWVVSDNKPPSAKAGAAAKVSDKGDGNAKDNGREPQGGAGASSHNGKQTHSEQTHSKQTHSDQAMTKQPHLSTSPAAPPADGAARPSINWGGWISAGAALAAGGLAITLGVLSNSAADDAADLDVGSAEAQSQHDRAKALALGTNILIGVAAAGAVSATLFFILGRPSRARRDASVGVLGPPALSAAPLWLPGGGAGLVIRGSLPALR